MAFRAAEYLDDTLSDEGLEAVRLIEGFHWARVIRR